MPPLAGIAVAALASSAAVGTALGLGGSIAAAIGGIIDAGAIIDGVVTGAVIGAGAGATTAAAAGADPGEGALWGAATGGVSGGLTPEIQGVAPSLTATEAQSVASGITTTGAALAQGQDIGTALERGAAGGAATYIGGQIFSGASDAGTKGATSATQPANVGAASGNVVDTPGMEPIIVTPPVISTTDFSGDFAVPKEQITVPGKKPEPSVDVTAGSALPTERITVPGTKEQSNVTSTNILDFLTKDLQRDPGALTAERSALKYGLLDLLFGSGGGAPGYRSQTGAGGGAAAQTAPAAQAAQAAQVGQTGGRSIYGPGGPIFGEPGGATKYSPWNVASLRTDQGNA